VFENPLNPLDTQPGQFRRGQGPDIQAGEFIRLLLKAGKPDTATAAGRMGDEIVKDARPGEDVLRPAETQVGEIFRRKGQRGLAVCLHQIASRSPGKIWESLVQEGKWSDRSQTRVGVEIESAGNEPR